MRAGGASRASSARGASVLTPPPVVCTAPSLPAGLPPSLLSWVGALHHVFCFPGWLARRDHGSIARIAAATAPLALPRPRPGPLMILRRLSRPPPSPRPPSNLRLARGLRRHPDLNFAQIAALLRCWSCWIIVKLARARRFAAVDEPISLHSRSFGLWFM